MMNKIKIDALTAIELKLKPNRDLTIDELIKRQMECAACDHLVGVNGIDPKTRGELLERAERLRSEANQIIDWLRENP